MENTSRRLMLGCSATALLLSLGTAAQAQNEETMIVSSTRLQNAGFDAPTPTTVVGIEDIQRNAQPNVFEAMTQLPALQGSTGVTYNTGSTTTGLMGLSALNLRALGVLRTLVLIDNQRIVGGNPNGAVDVSMIPQALIQRVDIVTGGASASWGSDAVAGVVNFVTDKRFEGFKANLMGGQTTYGDNNNATMQFAAGTSFLGGKAHFEVAGEYSYTAGVNPPKNIPNQFAPELYPGGRAFYSTYGNDSRGTPTAAVFATCGATNTCLSQRVLAPLAQNIVNYPYGMIVSGPLQGTIFGINGGQAGQFDYAGGCTPNFTGGNSNSGGVTGTVGNTCFGTAADPGDQTARQWTNTMVAPLTRGNIYSRLSYEIAPGTEIYGTVTMSSVRTVSIPAQGNSNRNGITMKCDNAFLPASGAFGIGLSYAQTIAACNTLYAANGFDGVTQAQLNAYAVNPINTLASYGSFAPSSATMAATTATGAPVRGFSISTTNGNIPYSQIVNMTRNLRRYVVGAQGGFSVFGSDWTWDTYVQHGETSVSFRIFNMPLKNRFNFAIDSIQLPTGQIVCRDVAARNNGCVPYNPFTTDIATPGAVAYFYNQANGSRLGGPLMTQSMRQEAFSLNFNGSPLELWAGKLSVAAGFDYREEAFYQRADPYSGGITSSTPANSVQPCTDPSIDCRASGPGIVNPGNWNAGNYTSGMGNYHVWELYTEMGVPIFNMPDSIGKLDASIAGRFERYSTAGDFTTWKVGVTWETPLPGVKMRALQSRDVRAPNLSDLFLPPQTLNGSFINRWVGQNSAAQQVGQTNAGNPLLLPERGQTTEVGIVWQPDFLPGFQASLDYYRIAIKGIISSSGVQTVVDLCFQGFTQYCSQQFIATANGQAPTSTAGNRGAKGDPNEVLAIVAVPFNTAGLLTDGFDFEFSYQFDLEDWDIPGNFLVRSLVNRTSKFLADPGIPGQFTQERAGVLGGGFNSDTYNANTGNVLNYKITEQQNWQGEKWGFTLIERWYAGGVMFGRWTSANNPLGLPNGTPGLQYLTCNPGSCPAPTLQMPTVNYQRVPSILYLDVGGSYNWDEKTQFYFKIDNIANQEPPNTGGSNVNNTLYDVIGRMYRVGVRFNN